MSDETEIADREGRVTCCLACGTELKNYSILVCAECLDDECGVFQKLAETVEDEK